MEYLADTNIYRGLVRGLSLEEVKLLAFKIRRKEAEKGHKAGFPIVVAMELIRHLKLGDPHFDECFKALCLLFDHSKNYIASENKYSGTLYPPMNVVLPKFFFNANGEYFKLYSTIIRLTHDITENYNIKNVDKFQEQIRIIGEQVLFEKKEIKDNYENFLKSINDDVLDWEYFKNNKPDRKEWFKNLHSGKMTFLVAEGFMQRAYSIMKIKYERNEENFKLLADFYDKFYPAIAMNELLLKEIGNGTLSLENLEDKKWNTINDISIMFGILFFPDVEHKLLLTEDKNIIKYFKENGMGNKILSLEDFKTLLEL